MPATARAGSSTSSTTPAARRRSPTRTCRSRWSATPDPAKSAAVDVAQRVGAPSARRRQPAYPWHGVETLVEGEDIGDAMALHHGHVDSIAGRQRRDPLEQTLTGQHVGAIDR